MKKSRRRQTDTAKEEFLLLLHPIIRKIPNTTIGARAFVMIADLCNNGKELGDKIGTMPIKQKRTFLFLSILMQVSRWSLYEVIFVMFIFHSTAVKFLLFNLHIHCVVEWIQFEVPILLTIYHICSNFKVGTLGANHQLL